MTRSIYGATLALLILVGAANADTLVLKNGRSIPAKSITEEKGRVYVDHGGGCKISLPKSMVLRIEKDDNGGVAPVTTRR
jgi:hypothetical protein